MTTILGDSDYPQRPWLMTPVRDAAPGTQEANYNKKRMVARVIIDNTFGRLKKLALFEYRQDLKSL